MIWIERNNWIFRETKRTPKQIVSKIKALFSESIPYFLKALNNNPLAKDEEEWLRLLGIQARPSPCSRMPLNCSWELRMGKMELDNWKLSKNLNFLSFDGASKGNLGAAEGGGIISKKDGTSILWFAWGLGVASNNREESLSLWQGLNQALLLNIRDMVVLGDSRVIIQALNKKSRLGNAIL
jgi:hypothetical protein